MNNQQIKYFLIALLASTIGFVVYPQEQTAAQKRVGKILGHIEPNQEQQEAPLPTVAEESGKPQRRISRLGIIMRHLHPTGGSPSAPPTIKQPIKQPEPPVLETNKGLSQSLGFLSVISLERALPIVSTSEGGKKLKWLIDKVIKKEKEQPGYFVFYHGTRKEVMIVLDVMKQLYALSEQEQVKRFEFLRAPTALAPNLSPEEFLKKYQGEFASASRFDTIPHIYSQILSVNLSVPGHQDPGESSLAYFATSTSQMISISKIIGSAVDTLFDKSSVSEEYIEVVKDLMGLKFIRLGDIFKDVDFGLLLQIFIPRSLVDKNVYLAFDYGVPIKGKYESRISLLLDELQKNPQVLGDKIKKLQARIILNKNLFNRPGVVKIDRYHMMPQETYNNWYLPLVRKVADELLLMWLVRPPINQLIEKNASLIEGLLNDDKYEAFAFVKKVLERGYGYKTIWQMIQKDYHGKQKFIKIIIENSYEIPAIIQFANNIARIDPAFAVGVFEALVKKGYGLPDALKLAMQIQDTKKEGALKLFIELVRQNYGVKAALQIVPRAFDSDSVEIRKLGCQLLTALMETGNLKQVSWPLVSGVIKKDVAAYPETIFDLLRTFIKKKYKMPEVLNLAVLIGNTTNHKIVDLAFGIIKDLIKQGYSQEEIMKAMKKNNVKQDSLLNVQLLTLFVGSDYDAKQALKVALEALNSTNFDTIRAGGSLLVKLVQKGRSLSEALAVAKELVFKRDGAYKKIAFNLFNALFKQGIGIQEAQNIITDLMAKKNKFSIILGLSNELVKAGYGFNEVTEVAIQLKDTQPHIAVNMFSILVNQGKGIESAIQAATAWCGGSLNLQNNALGLFIVLVQHGYGIKQAAACALKAEKHPRLYEKAIKLKSLIKSKQAKL